jgi:hypothetical protein
MQQQQRSRNLLRLGFVLALVAGLAFRLHTRSELWLDEALTVNIARLPLRDLFEHLRHDGHPPLYYVLLHGWMKVFGDGNDGARSLSGVFGIATVPLLWFAVRRWAGEAAALAAVVLLAMSPFAVRYSTEARMYSLVSLLVVGGWLAVRWALDRPAPGRLAVVAVLAGLLALTHYWSFYLLAALGIVLLVRWRRGDPASLRVALGLVAGGVLFLPWLPSFLEQMGHTGTPWGLPARPTTILAVTFTDWGGGPNPEATVLSWILLGLIALALFGRARNARTIELDVRSVPGARVEAAVVLLTMVIATIAAYASAAAFASRYTAVVFPLAIAIAGLGAAQVLDRRVVAGVLAVAVALGGVGVVRNFRDERTQAPQLASYIAEQGQPGDVVAFCPDQLGPSTMRLLPKGFVGLTFPDGGDPRFVDWADYAEHQRSRSPKQFAEMIDARATDAHTVWLVWSESYRTVGKKCTRTVNELKKLRRGGAAVRASGPQFEHAWLYQYGPDAGRGSP